MGAEVAMRKSRLFLGLSVISMIAAVGLGMAQDHCPYSCTPVCQVLDSDKGEVYAAFEQRDFEAMEHHARELINRGRTVEGRRLVAYALRGQGRHREAIAAYHESMQDSPRPVRIDACVGLADCFAGLGMPDRALEWINLAEKEARDQLSSGGSEARYYALACVLSVRSGIEQGKNADISRARAIEYLHRAIGSGFDSWAHMEADQDLDPIRDMPEFKALIPQA
jgi:tetratricopeptide (TPR) repeat protein